MPTVRCNGSLAVVHDLRRVAPFSACTNKELDLIAGATTQLRFPAGEELAREGDNRHEFVVIVEGAARVDIGERKVATLGAGELFGEIAPLDGEQLWTVALFWLHWRHGGAGRDTRRGMPSIQVKDVPEGVHATLGRRAAAAGMSLQEYLLGRLVEDANAPTLHELMDRAGGRAGGCAPLAKAAKAVRSDRNAR